MSLNPELLKNPAERIASAESIIQNQPEIVGLQAYEYLRNDAVDQKADFINGNDLNLSYPAMSPKHYKNLADTATDVLIQLGLGEKTDKTNALYDSIEYRLAEMSLLSVASAIQTHEGSDDDRAALLDTFRWMNEALYGVPQKEVFTALLDRELATVPESEDPTAQTMKAELQQLLGDHEPSEYELYKPSTETLNRLNGLIRERFEPLLTHIDPEKTYEKDEVVDVLNEMIHRLDAEQLGWRAEIVPNSSALAVSAHQKLVEVGENRKALDGTELAGKAIHEVGVHALRSINAERAGWLSAAYGQDGYLAFEEAMATALEDAYKGKFADHGVNYYLIAGLAYGLDGHEPRNMHEVHDVMYRLDALQAAGSSEITEDQITKSQNKLFTSCMRLFRGTTTKDAGVVYLKDLAYFNGQELAWSVLDKIYDQDDVDVLLAGKLDLTRDDHIDIATSILVNNKA